MSKVQNGRLCKILRKSNWELVEEFVKDDYELTKILVLQLIHQKKYHEAFSVNKNAKISLTKHQESLLKNFSEEKPRFLHKYDHFGPQVTSELNEFEEDFEKNDDGDRIW